MLIRFLDIEPHAKLNKSAHHLRKTSCKVNDFHLTDGDGPRELGGSKGGLGLLSV